MDSEKSSEKLNQLSELELYQNIYSNAKDSVFLVIPETYQIVFANLQAVEDTGFEAEELTTNSFLNLFLTEDQEAIKILFNATLEWNSGVDS